MRFIVKENTPRAYGVYDNQAKDFHRPENVPAVSIYMRKDAADKICELMNKEWQHFLNNPS